MSEQIPIEIRVSVDVGAHSHNVAIGLSSGEVLRSFRLRTGWRVLRISFRALRGNSERECVWAEIIANLA